MWTALASIAVGAAVSLLKWWLDRKPNTVAVEDINEIIHNKQRTKRDIDNLDSNAVNRMLEKYFRK